LVLFDLDGTLVDSSSAILDAYLSAISSVLGYDLDPDKEHVHDLLRRRPIEYFRQHYPPAAEALAEHYALNYTSESVVAYDGVMSLLDQLFGVVPVGIVSNKGRDRIASDLKRVGLDPARFWVIVGAEDTALRKPHPEPILRAISGVRPEPGRVFYVGDGPHDVIAAKAAGTTAVAVSWGYYPEPSLSAAEPEHLVSDVEGLATLLRRELA
jgi:pyrophosphatase PpaX